MRHLGICDKYRNLFKMMLDTKCLLNKHGKLWYFRTNEMGLYGEFEGFPTRYLDL